MATVIRSPGALRMLLPKADAATIAGAAAAVDFKKDLREKAMLIVHSKTKVIQHLVNAIPGYGPDDFCNHGLSIVPEHFPEFECDG